MPLVPLSITRLSAPDGNRSVCVDVHCHCTWTTSTHMYGMVSCSTMTEQLVACNVVRIIGIGRHPPPVTCLPAEVKSEVQLVQVHEHLICNSPHCTLRHLQDRQSSSVPGQRAKYKAVESWTNQPAQLAGTCAATASDQTSPVQPHCIIMAQPSHIISMQS